MNIYSLRELISYGLLLVKIVIAIWVIVLYNSWIYTYDQIVDIYSIVFPLFATQLTLIFKFYFEGIQAKATVKPTQMVGRPVVVLSMGLILVYLFYMIAVLTFRKPVQDLKNTHALIALGETFAGVYIGIIVTNLFSNPKKGTT